MKGFNEIQICINYCHQNDREILLIIKVERIGVVRISTPYMFAV